MSAKKIISEADTKIAVSKNVFYNKQMKLNRDISIALLKAINKKNMVVCLPMAATGVRAIRMLKELPKTAIKEMHVNDIDKTAVKNIKQNLKLNKLEKDKRIKLSNKDGRLLMLEQGGYDYIDIDPFGSPNTMLDSAILKLARGGFLAVTATDTSALAGTHMRAGLRKYWAKGLKNELMHELGLRMLIRRVQLTGADHEKALFPIYAFATDHYYRVFFICKKGRKLADEVVKEHAHLLYCKKCLSRQFNKINHAICCKNIPMQWAGPMWTGQLWDKDLAAKIYKLLSNQITHRIRQESEIKDSLLFYDLHKIAKYYRLPPPKTEDSLIKLKQDKVKAAPTHFSDTGIRTNVKIKQFVNIIKKKTKKK
jgi:tRNA (guanine26-N2/guanine27-N2)-dimethyltransferase